MKKILILSHTNSYSYFKIGSHHYANGLSQKEYLVYYSGLPINILHFLKLRRIEGGYKLNEKVVNRQFKTLIPATAKKNSFFIFINKLYSRYINKVENIFDDEFDVIIFDTPFFVPFVKIMKSKIIIYRPTDNYQSMVGDKAIWYEDIACHNSKFIVATSDTVSQNLVKKYPDCKKKTYVIKNGYDSFFFRNDKLASRRDAIYVGALDYRFDFDMLEYLARNNLDVNFHIYGPKDKKSEKEIEKFKQIGNVNFYDSIDYEKLNTILNKYKVGLLLVKNTEANQGRSPMKLWEYLSTGLNVLFTGISDIENINGVYKYNNTLDIQDAFIKALSNDNIHDELDLYKHTWEYKVSELETFFNKRV